MTSVTCHSQQVVKGPMVALIGWVGTGMLGHFWGWEQKITSVQKLFFKFKQVASMTVPTYCRMKCGYVTAVLLTVKTMPHCLYMQSFCRLLVVTALCVTSVRTPVPALT